MIKVTIFYPGGDGIIFDIDYFCNTHVPMVAGLLGDALKAGAVDAGIANGEGGSPDYVAMGHLTFESTEAFQEAFAPHAEAIMADVPNYTNGTPKLQISEIKM